MILLRARIRKMRLHKPQKTTSVCVRSETVTSTMNSEVSEEKNTMTQPTNPESSASTNSGHENLNYYIKSLYGENTFKWVRQLDTLRKWKANHLSLTFLLRCRDLDIIPKFLKTKNVLTTGPPHLQPDGESLFEGADQFYPLETIQRR